MADKQRRKLKAELGENIDLKRFDRLLEKDNKGILLWMRENSELVKEIISEAINCVEDEKTFKFTLELLKDNLTIDLFLANEIMSKIEAIEVK